MNVSSLQELKQELQEQTPKQLLDLCLSLAKYKKDNKEYLGYLLFQSHDNSGFVENVKAETDELFQELKSQSNLYYIKKGLRRILRILNKYCRYVGDKGKAAEIQLHFIRKIKEQRIPLHKDKRLQNLFDAQIKKVAALIAALHEDLQADYVRELEEIMVH